MITTLAAYDVTVSSWFIYAFTMMLANPVYSLVIVCITTALLFFVVGKLWGLAWNKKWDFSGSRFLIIGAVSLFGGLCLATINGLYGGKLFEMEVAEAMQNIHKAQKEGLPVTIADLSSPESVYTQAKSTIDKIIEMTRDSKSEMEGIDEISTETSEPSVSDDASSNNKSDSDSVETNPSPVINPLMITSYISALFTLWVVFYSTLAILVAGVAWFAYKDIKVKEAYNI